MKNKPYKRFLAFLLCAAMLITYMPSTAFTFADEGSDDQQTVEEAKPAAPAAEKKVEKKEEKKEEAKAEKAPAPATEEKVEAPAPEPKAEEPAETPKEEPAEKPEASGDETRAGPEETEPVKEQTDEPAEEAAGEAVEETTEEVVEETGEEAVDETGEEVVDEEALEEEEEEGDEEDAEKEVTYPAQNFSGAAGNVSVFVEAPKGALPENSSAEFRAVTANSVEGAVKAEMGKNAEVVAAVDITFKDKDGKEIEPEKQVSVRFVSSEFNNVDDASVVHIEKNGEGSKLADSKVEASGSKVEFDAKDFSVYVVVETIVPRLTVHFKNSDTEIASMIIKEADAEEVATIIYDPGAGTIPTGQVFKGWTTDETYTESSTIMTIDQVRTDAMDKVKTLSADGSETYYAVFFKQFTVTYVDANNITVGSDAAEMPANGTGASYKVNMAYATDSNHNFEGWIPVEGSTNIEGYPNNAETETIQGQEIKYYKNGKELSIKGDVKFSVNAPEGHWLVFDENGKGATYNAPQFVKAEDVTSDADLLAMTRKGYTFDGWYRGTKDEETGEVTFGEKFVFGGQLTENTTVYAKWEPIKNAGYTVILWTQNQKRNGYDVADSFVSSTGIVGQNIPYTVVENDAEDYVEFADGTEGHYTGFCLKDSDKNQTVEITPEGDAVLNLHFDRIVYDFKFYLYRNGTQDDRYDYANNSGNGSSLNNLVDWRSNQTQHPSVTGYDIQSETDGGRTYYYFVMNAYYGEDISAKWPKYSDITGANGHEAVSYVMMVGTKLKPNPTNQGSGTVKGIVTVLNENILGKTNDPDGNYVIVRFPDNYNNWRYHIWFETIEGEDYTGKTTHDYNGKTYYEETVLEVRSSNTTDANQNEPKYTGFDYVTRMGQNNQGVWGGGHWTTGNGNNTLYHLNYIYNRQIDNITYLDGAYYNGNGGLITDETSQGTIDKKTGIEFGTDLSSYNKGGANYFEPKPDSSHAGYVFEGWYTDEGCTAPYTFTTMPVGGITVYAKWRQIQYRVFLHPQAGTDPTLSWGKDEEGQEVKQETNFRVSYNGQVSTPTGTRTGYEFFGWYTDPECNNAYPSGLALNESTVTADYNKTTDLTDPSNKWGNAIATSNNDTDRFWITKKLDLYAKWNEVTVGANGINVVYDANGGSNPPEDTATYKDNTKVAAGAASTAPAKKVFSHWVVQKWNGEAFEDTDKTAVPGASFTVLKSNAKIVDSDGHVVAPSAVQEGKKYIYTVQLKAVYKDIEEETPTHINWYSNYGSENDGKGVLYRADTDIKINEAVTILGAQTRDGFTFKGWTKTKGGTTADFLAWDGSKYTATVEGETVDAIKVAADEQKPIEDLFAVWEESEVTINYAVASDSTDMGTVDPTKETVKVSTGTANGSTATPASSDYVFDYWTCDDGTAHVGDAATFVPSKNSNGVYEAHTYYAHFKASDAEYTVEFYYQDENLVYQKVDSLTDTRTGKIGDTVSATDEDKAKTSYEGETYTLNATASKLSETLAASGTVLTLKFDRTVDAKLKVTKTADKTSGVKAGDTITYTITIENTGNVTVSSLTLTDPLQGISLGSLDKTTIAPGETARATATYVVTQSDFEAGEIKNTATATGKDPKNADVTGRDSETVTTVECVPELTVTKTANPSRDVDTGDTITYTVVVKNTGDVKITGITLTDSLVTLSEDAFNLEPGAEKTVTYTYTVAEKDVTAGKVTNTATATGKDPKGEDVTGSMTVNTPTKQPQPEPPTPVPGLNVKKTSDVPKDTKVKLGDVINYTVKVTNTGNVDITGITVEDSLVPIEETPFDLAIGATKEINYSYTVTQADVDKGKVVNHATATGGDGTKDDDTIEIPTEDPKPELTVTKTASPSSGATEGTTIKYTIVVKNTGNVTVSDINISDSLVNVDERPFTLAPGETKTIKYSYKVTAADVEAGSVSNTATAKGSDPSGDDTPPGTDTVVVTTEEDDDDDDDDTPTPTPPAPAGPAGPAPAGPAGPAPGGPGVVPAAPAADGTPIADDAVPQAEPEVDIPDDGTPLAAGAWALINLIAAILTTLGAIVALFRKKEEEDEEDEEDQNKPKTDEEEEEDDNRGKKMLAAKIAGAVAGVVAPIVFFLTEDMSLPMQMIDKWTLLMVVFLAAQIVAAVFNKKASELDDEEEEEEAAPAN